MDEFPHITVEHTILKRNINYKFNSERCRSAGLEEIPNAGNYEVVKLRRVYHFNRGSSDHTVLTVPKPLFLLVDKGQIPEDINLDVSNDGDFRIDSNQNVKSKKGKNEDYFCLDDEVIIEKLAPDVCTKLNNIHQKPIEPLSNIKESFCDIGSSKTRSILDEVYENTLEPNVIITKVQNNIEDKAKPIGNNNVTINPEVLITLISPNNVDNELDSLHSEEMKQKKTDDITVFEPTDDDEMLWLNLYVSDDTENISTEELNKPDSHVVDAVEEEMEKIHGECPIQEHSYFQQIEEPVDLSTTGLFKIQPENLDKSFEIAPLDIAEEHDKELSQEIRKFIAQEHSYGFIDNGECSDEEQEHINGSFADKVLKLNKSFEQEVKNTQNISIEETQEKISTDLVTFNDFFEQAIHNIGEQIQTIQYPIIQQNLDSNSSQKESDKVQNKLIILEKLLLEPNTKLKVTHCDEVPKYIENGNQMIDIGIKQPIQGDSITKELQIINKAAQDNSTIMKPLQEEYETTTQFGCIRKESVEESLSLVQALPQETNKDRITKETQTVKKVDCHITKKQQIVPQPVEIEPITREQEILKKLKEGDLLMDSTINEILIELDLLTIEPVQGHLNLHQPLNKLMKEPVKTVPTITNPKMTRGTIHDGPISKEIEDFEVPVPKEPEMLNEPNKAVPTTPEPEIIKEPVQITNMSLSSKESKGTLAEGALTITTELETLIESFQCPIRKRPLKQLEDKIMEQPISTTSEPKILGKPNEEGKNFDSSPRKLIEHQIPKVPIKSYPVSLKSRILQQFFQDQSSKELQGRCQNLYPLSQEHKNVEEFKKIIPTTRDSEIAKESSQDRPIGKECQNLVHSRELNNQPVTTRKSIILLKPHSGVFIGGKCKNFDQLSQGLNDKKAVPSAENQKIPKETIQDDSNRKESKNLNHIRIFEDKIIKEATKTGPMPRKLNLLTKYLSEVAILENLKHKNIEQRRKTIPTDPEIDKELNKSAQNIKSFPEALKCEELYQLSQKMKYKNIEEPRITILSTTNPAIVNESIHSGPVKRKRQNSTLTSRKSKDKIKRRQSKNLIKPLPVEKCKTLDGVLKEHRKPIVRTKRSEIAIRGECQYLEPIARKSDHKFVQSPITTGTTLKEAIIVLEPLSEAFIAEKCKKRNLLSQELKVKNMKETRMSISSATCPVMVKESIREGPIRKKCKNLKRLTNKSEGKIVKQACILKELRIFIKPLSEAYIAEKCQKLNQSSQKLNDKTVERPSAPIPSRTGPELIQDGDTSNNCQNVKVQEATPEGKILQQPIKSDSISREPVEKCKNSPHVSKENIKAVEPNKTEEILQQSIILREPKILLTPLPAVYLADKFKNLVEVSNKDKNVEEPSKAVLGTRSQKNLQKSMKNHSISREAKNLIKPIAAVYVEEKCKNSMQVSIEDKKMEAIPSTREQEILQQSIKSDSIPMKPKNSVLVSKEDKNVEELSKAVPSTRIQKIRRKSIKNDSIPREPKNSVPVAKESKNVEELSKVVSSTRTQKIRRKSIINDSIPREAKNLIKPILAVYVEDKCKNAMQVSKEDKKMEAIPSTGEQEIVQQSIESDSFPKEPKNSVPVEMENKNVEELSKTVPSTRSQRNLQKSIKNHSIPREANILIKPIPAVYVEDNCKNSREVSKEDKKMEPTPSTREPKNSVPVSKEDNNVEELSKVVPSTRTQQIRRKSIKNHSIPIEVKNVRKPIPAVYVEDTCKNSMEVSKEDKKIEAISSTKEQEILQQSIKSDSIPREPKNSVPVSKEDNNVEELSKGVPSTRTHKIRRKSFKNHSIPIEAKNVRKPIPAVYVEDTCKNSMEVSKEDKKIEAISSTKEQEILQQSINSDSILREPKNLVPVSKEDKNVELSKAVPSTTAQFVQQFIKNHSIPREAKNLIKPTPAVYVEDKCQNSMEVSKEDKQMEATPSTREQEILQQSIKSESIIKQPKNSVLLSKEDQNVGELSKSVPITRIYKIRIKSIKSPSIPREANILIKPIPAVYVEDKCKNSMQVSNDDKKMEAIPSTREQEILQQFIESDSIPREPKNSVPLSKEDKNVEELSKAVPSTRIFKIRRNSIKNHSIPREANILIKPIPAVHYEDKCKNSMQVSKEDKKMEVIPSTRENILQQSIESDSIPREPKNSVPVAKENKNVEELSKAVPSTTSQKIVQQFIKNHSIPRELKNSVPVSKEDKNVEELSKAVPSTTAQEIVQQFIKNHSIPREEKSLIKPIPAVYVEDKCKNSMQVSKKDKKMEAISSTEEQEILQQSIKSDSIPREPKNSVLVSKEANNVERLSKAVPSTRTPKIRRKSIKNHSIPREAKNLIKPIPAVYIEDKCKNSMEVSKEDKKLEEPSKAIPSTKEQEIWKQSIKRDFIPREPNNLVPVSKEDKNIEEICKAVLRRRTEKIQQSKKNHSIPREANILINPFAAVYAMYVANKCKNSVQVSKEDIKIEEPSKDIPSTREQKILQQSIKSDSIEREPENLVPVSKEEKNVEKLSKAVPSKRTQKIRRSRKKHSNPRRRRKAKILIKPFPADKCKNSGVQVSKEDKKMVEPSKAVASTSKQEISKETFRGGSISEECQLNQTGSFTNDRILEKSSIAKPSPKESKKYRKPFQSSSSTHYELVTQKIQPNLVVQNPHVIDCLLQNEKTVQYHGPAENSCISKRIIVNGVPIMVLENYEQPTITKVPSEKPKSGSNSKFEILMPIPNSYKRKAVENSSCVQKKQKTSPLDYQDLEKESQCFRDGTISKVYISNKTKLERKAFSNNSSPKVISKITQENGYNVVEKLIDEAVATLPVGTPNIQKLKQSDPVKEEVVSMMLKQIQIIQDHKKVCVRSTEPNSSHCKIQENDFLGNDIMDPTLDDPPKKNRSKSQRTRTKSLNHLPQMKKKNLIEQTNPHDIFEDFQARCVLSEKNFNTDPAIFEKELDAILNSSIQDPLEIEMRRIHYDSKPPLDLIYQSSSLKEPTSKKPRINNPDIEELGFKGFTKEKQNPSSLINGQLIQNLEKTIAETLSSVKSVYRRIRRFKCNKCDFSTNKANHLKMHARCHILPFWCNACSANFHRVEDLRYHVNTCYKFNKAVAKLVPNLLNSSKTKFEVFKCGFCDYASAYLGRLEHHMLVHKKESLFECDLCTYSSLTEWVMERHKKEHDKQQDQYECEECGFITVHKQVIDQHVHLHSGYKMYKCEMCLFSTAHLGYYNAHLSFHSTKSEEAYENDGKEWNIKQSEIIYTCGECKHICRTQPMIYLHAKKMHSNKMYINISSNCFRSKIRYLCVRCGCSEQSINAFNSHLVIHTVTKPNKCTRCDFVASNEYNLKIHVANFHVNNKMYNCPKCHKNFTTIRSLKMHDANMH